ncbi:MAG: DNA-3-methyladenine glycosylase I [Flavobacteriaceae bacterium]|nr:DNA-3-methyladenine glycosylase I [Flavobacteriaceae bacterium]
MLNRCDWCKGNALYEKYHDEEWGVPAYDDKTLFEFILLESFQAGLSWLTILKKREGFREAFDDFDYQKIAAYQESDIQELIQNPKIVRNQLKIRAAVSNAQAFINIQKEYGSFSEYFWGFTNGKPIIHQYKALTEVPATTELSDNISKSLKSNGFKFMGSTVVYAHMQAVGMVNDHLLDCFRHKDLTEKSTM